MVGVAPFSMNYQYFASRLGLPTQYQWNFNQNAKNSNWGAWGQAQNYNYDFQFQNFGKNQKYIYCGWFFYCFDSKLYSDKPQLYKGVETKIKRVRDEIKLIFDVEKKSLKFIVNDEDLGDSYNDIPIDEQLTPAVLLFDENDSVEITTLL